MDMRSYIFGNIPTPSTVTQCNKRLLVSFNKVNCDNMKIITTVQYF